MAYFEHHQSLPHDPKTLHAAHLLKMDRHKFIGHLTTMWLWALDYANINGHLPETVTIEVLTEAAELPKKVTKPWSTALISAGGPGKKGFITVCNSKKSTHFILEDWTNIGGRLTAKRISNRQRMRDARAKNVHRTDDARAKHLTRARTPASASASAPAPALAKEPLLTPPPVSGSSTEVQFLSSFTEQETQDLKQRYPGLDLAWEARKAAAWWAQGKRKCQRPKVAFLNWCEKTAKKGDSWHERTGSIKREYTDEERQAAIGAPLR